jgi:hypothetical protein
MTHHDANPRLRSMYAMLFLAGVIFGMRALYLTTNQENVERAAIIVMNRPLASASGLSEAVAQMRAISSNVELFPLATIRKKLLEVAGLISTNNAEIEAQYQAWTKVKESIKTDAASYLEIRDRLAVLQRTQDKEILRLKEALAATQRPSLFADSLDLLLSFVLGVFSSIVASALWEWHSKRRRPGPG